MRFQTYAEKVSDELGLPLDEDIVQSNRPRRTGQGGECRLASRAEFDGPVRPGQDYLIVDDNVTQGGRLADLRSYVESRGGRVVGVTTLTGSRQSEISAPTGATISALRARVPHLEAKWKAAFGYYFSSLTRG